MVGAVSCRVGIQSRIIVRVSHGFETYGHTVANDGHGGLHDLKLFLKTVDALDDRIEAGA